MTEEQFQKLFEEQKAKDAGFALLAQLRFAYEFAAPDEYYDLLLQTDDFRIREWMHFSLMEGFPMNQIRAYPKMKEAEIQESRKQYFYKKEGVLELKEAEDQMERSLQKLRMLVEKSQSIEVFLSDMVNKKDILIENLQQQISHLQEENSKCAARIELDVVRLKSYEEQLELQKEPDLVSKEENAAVKLPESKEMSYPWMSRKKRRHRKQEDAITDYLKHPAWSPEQMAFLVGCLEEGMELDEIKMISSPEIPVERMEMLKRVLAIRMERNR